MGLPFYVREPQQRPLARFELRKDLRNRRIVFIVRRTRSGFGHRGHGLLEFPTSPSIHDQIAGDPIHVPPPLLFVVAWQVGAQYSQKGLLNDVVSIGFAAHDAMDIRAESRCAPTMERRKRRLIETAHDYSVDAGGSPFVRPLLRNRPSSFDSRYDSVAETRNPIPMPKKIVATALTAFVTSPRIVGVIQP